MKNRWQQALAELGAAVPLGMVGLLLANDHLFKARFDSGVTGKLSDIAICFLLPLLVSAVLGMAGGWPRERRLWIGAALAALVFSLLEMSNVAGALFVRAMTVIGIGPVLLTRDPTDLWALATIPLAVAYGRRRIRPVHPRLATAAGAVALITASTALMATSPPPRCDQTSAPAVLQAEPGCGPGGIFVVDAQEWDGTVTISNPQVLGLPPAQRPGDVAPSAHGQYLGAACPFTLEKGEWEVFVGACSAPTEAARTCSPGYRHCSSLLQGGELWFECLDGTGARTCRSRLTTPP